MYSILIRKQRRHSDQHAYLCAVDCVSLSNSILGFLTRLQCTHAAWSVFSAVANFSMKQLKFEIYITLCQYSITVFFWVLKIKLNLVKLTFRTAISSHQVMGMLSKKCEVWKIYHTEYGPFLPTDWLKSKGSGRVMG